MSFTRGVQIFFVQNEKMLKILVCKACIFVLLIILVLVNVVDNVVDLASQARVLFMAFSILFTLYIMVEWSF